MGWDEVTVLRKRAPKAGALKSQQVSYLVLTAEHNNMRDGQDFLILQMSIKQEMYTKLSFFCAYHFCIYFIVCN